jgi:hypothetical protein
LRKFSGKNIQIFAEVIAQYSSHHRGKDQLSFKYTGPTPANMRDWIRTDLKSPSLESRLEFTESGMVQLVFPLKEKAIWQH